MRLIDADALKKEVDNFQNCYNGWSDTYDKAFIIGAIEDAPTIDAVSVVRCGECKHMYDGIKGDGYLICHKFNHFIKADDFCSYAERSDT